MKVFLDASFWGTYPQWGSFIVALGALILGFIGFLTKKVNDVEKVVKELKDQNIILAKEYELNKKRFEHETKVPISETRPVFKKENQIPIPSQSQIHLILKNEGTRASEIKIEYGEISGANWSIVKHPSSTAPKGGEIGMYIYSGDPHFEGVKFDLTYYGEDDKKYTQSIAKKYGGNFQIENPT